MPTIKITSDIHNGSFARITYYSVNYPNIGENLGTQQLPYTRNNNEVYGRYVLYFPDLDLTCESFIAVPPTTTTTTTVAPTTITTTVAPAFWVQRGQDIDGEAASDQSGSSVSLSSDGSVVAIGANLNDGNGTNSGHVRVYQFVPFP